jgi:hypothetical protein
LRDEVEEQPEHRHGSDTPQETLQRRGGRRDRRGGRSSSGGGLLLLRLIRRRRCLAQAVELAQRPRGRVLERMALRGDLLGCAFARDVVQLAQLREQRLVLAQEIAQRERCAGRCFGNGAARHHAPQHQRADRETGRQHRERRRPVDAAHCVCSGRTPPGQPYAASRTRSR